jgi:hypothetical protein
MAAEMLDAADASTLTPQGLATGKGTVSERTAHEFAGNGPADDVIGLGPFSVMLKVKLCMFAQGPSAVASTRSEDLASFSVLNST